MDATEMIANTALELLGGDRGDYRRLHPLEHVNLGQSTDDVYPTAVKVALQLAVRRLRATMDQLANAFADKGIEFAGETAPTEGERAAQAPVAPRSYYPVMLFAAVVP